jgi:hypothetical protein
MISRVLFAAFILVFVIAHGVALQKMQAAEHANRGASGAIAITNGD